MKNKQGRLWLKILLLLVLCGKTLVSNSDILDPVIKEGQIISDTIYDTKDWFARVPIEVALPIIARMKLKSMLRDLDLPVAVRKRVLARLNSQTFVDEIVPFLMKIKSLYMTDQDYALRISFNQFLRKRRSQLENIPGIQHDLFGWEEKATKGQGVGLDPYISAQLVKFYDAIYLQENAPETSLGKNLNCLTTRSKKQLKRISDRARSITRDTLKYGYKLLPKENEYAEAIKIASEDDDKLQAITVSLIELLDQQVCKHYKIFSREHNKMRQLKRWLTRELNKAARGEKSELWSYLEFSNNYKPYAMHIVVDGLQGQLVKSLALGRKNDPFFVQVRNEMRRAKARFYPGGKKIKLELHRDFFRYNSKKPYVSENYLDFFRRIYTQNNAIAQSGISTTPTISVRNLPIAMTGASVIQTGLPNFHFVDRRYAQDGVIQGRPYYFYGNDALRIEGINRRNGMKTVFQRLPYLNGFSCGAQFDTGTQFSLDAFVNLAVGEQKRDFGELICLSALMQRVENEKKLRVMRKQLLDLKNFIVEDNPWWQIYRRWGKRNNFVVAKNLIAKIASLSHRGMPDYFLYYNPWPDHFAHFKGPFSDEILSPSGELNRLDFWLQKFTKAYDLAGVLPRTLFAMAGDHGLTPVETIVLPQERIFTYLKKRGYHFRVEKISSDEGEGPKLTNRLQPPSMKGIDVVIASTAGGNFMMDFFKDQKDGFIQQPLYSDLLSISPLQQPHKKHNMINTILTRLDSSLEYMVVRESPFNADGGQIRIMAQANGMRSSGFIERRGSKIYYEYRGKDLLQTNVLSSYRSLSKEERLEHGKLYQRCHRRTSSRPAGAVKKDPSTWCQESQWRQLSAYTVKPDAVAQLAHLYDTDLAGTVNLFPVAGVGYNTQVPGRHAGEHFHEKDAFVGLWGEPISQSTKPLIFAINGSIAASVYQYLSRQRIDATWGYKSILPTQEASQLSAQEKQ